MVGEVVAGGRGEGQDVQITFPWRPRSMPCSRVTDPVGRRQVYDDQLGDEVELVAVGWC